MAEDAKFKFENGQFINRVSGEAIPDDEPVIIFRARDIHAHAVLLFYHSRVRDPHHKKAVGERCDEFFAFQRTNHNRMKEPGTSHHMRLSTDGPKIGDGTADAALAIAQAAFEAGWEACLNNYGAVVEEPTNTIDRLAGWDSYEPSEDIKDLA